MRNKPHKQKHASKREVARQQSGGGGRATERRKPAFARIGAFNQGKKGGNTAGTKDREAQAAAAQRKLRGEEVKREKSIGGVGGPPRIVAFIPLNESSSAQSTHAQFYASCDVSLPETAVSHCASGKHRFTTILCDDLDEQRILDVVKVSDVVVMSIDCSIAVQETIKQIGSQEQQDFEDGRSDVSGATWFADIGLCITDTTRELLHAINSHGCPTAVIVVQGLDSYQDERKQRYTLRIHERYFRSMMAEETKVLCVDSQDQAAQFLRTVANCKLRSMSWRDIRPYFVIDDRQYDRDSGVLEVRGFLRGANASASMLYHLTNHNTFKALSISAPGDPCPIANLDEMVGELDGAESDIQESLTGVRQNETANEDGDFPTEADVAFAQQQKTVWAPEGVSEYQAAWYDEDDGDAPAAVHHRNAVDTASRRSQQTDVALLRAADVLRHEGLTDEEREFERQQLLEACEDEDRHPDEIDTPVDIPARQRFAKYRFMKSFSSSAWDAKENLPIEYSRIFELSGYSRIRDDAVAEAHQCPVQVGTYISVRLANVPEATATAELLVCSGQLRHEQKWSVIHCHVQRSSEYAEPIKSKTTMLAHIGFRKFLCEPIFSDAVVGNRSKFARYFLPGEKFRIATFFAPISYHPCPVMLYEAPVLEEMANRPPLRLALFGSVLPPNPDFLILKRVVLTGRIAVIHKKQLVVKYMFFNEDDVKWFAPVDLFTRLGRQGRIIKAVGTHGLFKASFNDTVFQHDTICMSLYKRVFPKWRTVPYDEADMGEDDDEDDD